MRTRTRPQSHNPFFTAADAAPQDDEPDASVNPAPRSQIRISSVSRARGRANWTFVRLGKAGCVSIIGPRRRHSAGSRRFTNVTQCGLPTETAVTRSVVQIGRAHV